MNGTQSSENGMQELETVDTKIVREYVLGIVRYSDNTYRTNRTQTTALRNKLSC